MVMGLELDCPKVSRTGKARQRTKERRRQSDVHHGRGRVRFWLGRIAFLLP